MATALVESQTLANTEPETQTKQSEEGTVPVTAAEPTQSDTESQSRTRRESTIHKPDPNAFKITILLASSGYRTHISINRAFLEKASLHEGDDFLVSQLKNALWKDWPAGMSPFHIVLSELTHFSDWPEPLPPSPNFLRLIFSGKMLADKSTLSGMSKFRQGSLIVRLQHWSGKAKYTTSKHPTSGFRRG